MFVYVITHPYVIVFPTMESALIRRNRIVQRLWERHVNYDGTDPYENYPDPETAYQRFRDISGEEIYIFKRMVRDDVPG